MSQSEIAQDAAVARPKSERLLSLDTLRGLTIAGMILVNNPGSWNYVWGPLGHAEWDGWTPTDLIFPFFLFMVGVAMTYSFDKRLAQGASRKALMGHVICRAIVLFLLGMILTGFPNLRLITPYILGIIGLEILLERPSRKPGAPIGYLLPIAIACLVVAVAWFVWDFNYFHSLTTRSRWSDWWPAAPDPEKGSYIRIPGVLQRIAMCYV
ncbi:MAG: heparan-alpha-glucosaminide N-acetyltransferase domain-containing protein, partial [Candidatus Sumerlaeaceae bacterium]|nr:heparan-alpha-glucosaminide N-acetyltransferase domain-containing protein [Candidatus Sumerlaeaceae bacterium]